MGAGFNCTENTIKGTQCGNSAIAGCLSKRPLLQYFCPKHWKKHCKNCKNHNVKPWEKVKLK